MTDPGKKFVVELALWVKFRPAAKTEIDRERELRERLGKLLKGRDESDDPNQIELLATGLKKTHDDMVENLAQIESLIAELKEFTANNPDFVEEYDEVKSLSDDLSNARLISGNQAVKAKQAMLDANKALAQAKRGSHEIEIEWTKVDAAIDAAESNAADRFDSVKQALADGKSAEAAHDIAALQQAQAVGMMANILQANSTAPLKEMFAKFNKSLAAAEFAKEVTEKLRPQLAAAEKKIGDIGRKYESIAQMQRQLGALKVKIDMHKVAAALGGVAANVLPKIEKALSLDPTGMVRALEEALKSAAKPMKGKDAVDKLKKAKLI